MSKRNRVAKRNEQGQYARNGSKKMMLLSWLGSLASIALLLAAGAAVLSSFSAFRSCDSNSSGLSINACGKQSLNIGDFVLVGLFILTAALTVSVCTASWRMTIKRGPI